MITVNNMYLEEPLRDTITIPAKSTYFTVLFQSAAAVVCAKATPDRKYRDEGYLLRARRLRWPKVGRLVTKYRINPVTRFAVTAVLAVSCSKMFISRLYRTRAGYTCAP